MSVPGEPFSLACDREMNVAVATIQKSVHLFNAYEGKLFRSFHIGLKGKGGGPVQIGMTQDSEVFFGTKGFIFKIIPAALRNNI